MARYPSFEEYQKRGNFQDGLKRCDDLLKKNPNDVQLLTAKLQLLRAVEKDIAPVLDSLIVIQPPIVDAEELIAIEDAVQKSQADVFPRPETIGPSMAKLWDNAVKACNSTNQKADLLSNRFAIAVAGNRMADAQQALIQLKAVYPKNRVIYMAHAAVTQLRSTSKGDLQSRLALSLARKAVAERFDDDKSLDCRAPGQIFALQGREKDLETISDRPFGQSKQVYDALRHNRSTATNGISSPDTREAANLPSSEWLHSEVESLKHQFADLVDASAPFTSYLPFAANAIRLSHIAMTALPVSRRRASADVCSLSISALIRLYELTNNLRHVIVASYLTETLLKQDKNIHEARMILVYLYMRLGLGSLALHYFDSLNIKEIQYDTVGHTLFHRISCTHPHGTILSKKQSIDPFKRASLALTVYPRHEEKLAENAAGALNHEQTGMIFDLHELRVSLERSLSRRIIHLEQRRLARLVNDTSGLDTLQLGPRLTANWLAFRDNRDFAATFNHGYGVEKILHGFSNDIAIKRWILYSLAADSAWCLAMGFPTPVIDTENLLQEHENVALDFEHLRIDDTNAPSFNLVNAEYLAGDLACQVLRFQLLLTTKDAKLSRSIGIIKRALEKLNVEALVSTPHVFGARLRDHYVYADILRIVITACGSARKILSDDKMQLQSLEESSRDYFNRLQKHSKDQTKHISADDVKAWIEQDGDASGTLNLFSHSGVEAFYESIGASAREGWEGLSKIKLQ